MIWDFVIPGIPLSVNSKDAKKKQRWIEHVRSCATGKLPEDGFPLSGDVSVSVTYFHSGGTDVDIDNILKRIIDGMYPEVMDDDAQIQDVSASRREMVGASFRNPPPIILPYLVSADPFVYVTVYAAMPQEELPWIGKMKR
ncbi:RusA family crossover junction endodeoxyribonuclease [Streptomyces sp. CAI-85]|uniref:RusA family crossover junction endodeoxyribonuclease n=1 Tax=Streptomyces sp. CAI-85 TaxID=1472662 RepID=UPI0015876A28|nr:RusA family crossover junction endodeoxyribonuclease [Streptomyces sp. CAI-85]NUV60084.1 RusA family crossover junction endodeoxyribonuclease [Streptomyces sp. CAI-85]